MQGREREGETNGRVNRNQIKDGFMLYIEETVLYFRQWGAIGGV